MDFDGIQVQQKVLNVFRS